MLRYLMNVVTYLSVPLSESSQLIQQLCTARIYHAQSWQNAHNLFHTTRNEVIQNAFERQLMDISTRQKS